jgi:6-phosphogluconolactonase
MRFVSYADRARHAYGVAAAISLELKKAIELGGHATLCVAGGTTPAPAFDILAGALIDWSKVTVIPTDERWVDEKDPRSNAALVKKHLLVGEAAKAKYISFYAKGKTPAAGIDSITKKLTPHLPITVLLAGMGLDKHTASLFPDAEGIKAAMADDAPPLMVMQPASQPEARITLTAPVLAAAQHIHIMITGADKRAVVEGMGAPLPEKAPVSILLGRAQVHWAE